MALWSVWMASGCESVIVGTFVICGSTRNEDDDGKGRPCCSKLETEAATWLLERRLIPERLCLPKEGTCGFNRLVETPWKGEGKGEGEGEKNVEGGY